METDGKLVARRGAGNGLSSVSADLCALLFDTYLYWGDGDARDLLLCSLGADLENWRTVDGELGVRLVRRSTEAMDEVGDLSAAACGVLLSVAELAQADRVGDEDALVARWFAFLQAQDEGAYRAPVMFDRWVRDRLAKDRRKTLVGRPVAF